MNVVFSTGERAIYFPPAEVNSCFPARSAAASYSAYKIVSTLIVSVPTALFMSLALQHVLNDVRGVVRRHAPHRAVHAAIQYDHQSARHQRGGASVHARP